MSILDDRLLIEQYLVKASNLLWKNKVTHFPQEGDDILAIVDDNPLIGRVMKKEQLEHGDAFRIRVLGSNRFTYVNPFEVYEIL